MTSQTSLLTAHLGYWLRYVSNHVSHAFARKLEQRGVTVAEWVVLRELHDTQAMPPSRLADQLGLTRGAISKLADRLIAKDLLSREDDPGDRRAHSLSLTPAGRALVPDLATLADRNDEEFFGHLTNDQREEITVLLRDIVERRGLKTIPTS